MFHKARILQNTFILSFLWIEEAPWHSVYSIKEEGKDREGNSLRSVFHRSSCINLICLCCRDCYYYDPMSQMRKLKFIEI